MRSSVNFFLTVFFLFSSYFFSESSYIYPVSAQVTDDHHSLFFIHQSHPYALSLFELDVPSGESTSLLPASCIPASFTLLPDNSGFSFIDQGMIKIKKFAKRSARIVELSQPIHGMTHVCWCSNTCMYLSAQEGDFFGIFHVTSDGDVCNIVGQDGTHCRYPQKVDDQLFYIEERDGNFSLVTCPAPSIKLRNNFTRDKLRSGPKFLNLGQRAEADVCNVAGSENIVRDDGVQLVHVQNNKKNILLNFGATPKAFLYMKSASEGFCVEYPAQISMSEKLLECSYHRMFCSEEKKWCTQKLFTFCLPFDLLRSGSSMRLYESILPLLPRHINDHIFFVSQAEGQVPTTNIFSYDLKTGEILQRTSALSGELFFAPCLCGEDILYGYFCRPDLPDLENNVKFPNFPIFSS